MRSRTLAVVLVIIGVGALLGSFIYQAYSVRFNQQAARQQSQYLSSQQPYPLGNDGWIWKWVQWNDGAAGTRVGGATGYG